MIAVKISHLAPSHMRNRMSSVVKLIVWILTPAIAEQPHASVQQNLLFTHEQDRVQHLSPLSLHLQVLT